MFGSLQEYHIISIKNNDKYKYIKYFVETGTYLAESSLLAAKYFDNVISIEISPQLYNQNISLNYDTNKITFLLGDSLELLKSLDISSNEGIVYFLDAHQSGSNSSNNGKQLVPLIQELETIFLKPVNSCVFILNDVRFWKNEKLQASDWQHISKNIIIKLFIKHKITILDCYENDDKFWIFT
jgi:hypothetical protein